MPKQRSLSQIRSDLHRLTLDQAKELQHELERVIQELEQQAESINAKRNSEETAPSPRKGREVLQVHRIDHRLYQLEQVRCGKPNCKCAGGNGELHGPYWYAYWREEGKLKSRYVGKKLPAKSF